MYLGSCLDSCLRLLCCDSFLLPDGQTGCYLLHLAFLLSPTLSPGVLLLFLYFISLVCARLLRNAVELLRNTNYKGSNHFMAKYQSKLPGLASRGASRLRISALSVPLACMTHGCERCGLSGPAVYSDVTSMFLACLPCSECHALELYITDCTIWFPY